MKAVPCGRRPSTFRERAVLLCPRAVRAGQEAVLVVPYDRRFPLVRVRTRAPLRLLGQRLVVQVDEWPLGSK